MRGRGRLAQAQRPSTGPPRGVVRSSQSSLEKARHAEGQRPRSSRTRPLANTRHRRRPRTPPLDLYGAGRRRDPPGDRATVRPKPGRARSRSAVFRGPNMHSAREGTVAQSSSGAVRRWRPRHRHFWPGVIALTACPHRPQRTWADPGGSRLIAPSTATTGGLPGRSGYRHGSARGRSRRGSSPGPLAADALDDIGRERRLAP